MMTRYSLLVMALFCVMLLFASQAFAEETTTPQINIATDIHRLEVAQDNERQTIINELIASGESSIPLLVEALQKTEADGVKTAIVNILANIKGNKSFTTLVSCLHSDDYVIRREVAASLGGIENSTSVDTLLTVAQDEDPTVREKVALSLGLRKDVKAIPALTLMLDDADSYTRTQAALSLGLIGDPTPAPALLRSLRAPESKCDEIFFPALITALGQVHSADAVDDLLSRATTVPDYPTRLIAVNGLKEIGLPAAKKIISHCFIERKYTAHQLAPMLQGFDKDAFDLFDAYFKEGHQDVKIQAIGILSLIKNQFATEKIIGELNEQDSIVRVQAINALRVKQDKFAIQPLILLVQDKDTNVSAAAVTALKAMSGKDFGADADAWRQWWETEKK